MLLLAILFINLIVLDKYFINRQLPAKLGTPQNFNMKKIMILAVASIVSSGLFA